METIPRPGSLLNFSVVGDRSPAIELEAGFLDTRTSREKRANQVI